MIGKRKRLLFWVVTVLFTLSMGGSMAWASDKVPRMTVEQLKDNLGKADVVILDVRSKSDWEKADKKIQGAIREDPSKSTKTWAEKYGKDKTFVLYCA